MDKKQILVIEDDPEIQAALRTALEFFDYEVVSAFNGKEGLEKLAAMDRKPCAILLDLMMPVMNGWQFAEALEGKPEYSGIPIVVITAWPDKKLEQAKATLSKPIRFEELQEAVSGFC